MTSNLLAPEKAPVISQSETRPLKVNDKQKWYQRSFDRSMGLLLLPTGLVNLTLVILADERGSGRDSATGQGLAVGLVMAQACLISIGITLDSQPFWRRLLIYWSYLFGLLACWSAGYALWLIGDASRDTTENWIELSKDTGLLLCLVPLVSIAMQVPLWIARALFGWRIVLHGEGASSNHSAQDDRLALSHFFIGTAIVAIAFAGWRAVGSFTPVAPQQLVRAHLTGCGFALVTSLLAAVPFSRLGLGPLKTDSAFLILGSNSLASTIALTIFLSSTSGDIDVSALSLCLFGSFTGSLLLSMMILRNCGWRMIWNGATWPVVNATSSPESANTTSQ
ncbi:hypothetical protein ETAA8_42910 [Anatilimnocola aggregata]|uniref:Uncharacterized protein n=1 Tax=Anatilimnocola aggregata TaxID=2528021 RepID=A0A517YG32_9BACT|nr:hypothetical protein [Anatilimnocola aggregata]QDU29184.1 hypothetical protein ETAA8_42910 [Anatilimnocola aggregata]